MTDHYVIAAEAIENADTQAEVFEAFSAYDCTEGVVLRRARAISDRLDEIDRERQELEQELTAAGRIQGFRHIPIKDLAALRLFELTYKGEQSENLIQKEK